ncbi:response regulator transcription factor [Streptomyces sp. CRN 30]|uniref:response regulator n=1 Tax=Streptomyces sp. CRN 30 TaxID=3075613 RepID=UPI002A80E863|nr:response regulator transcription factor [Streptomyces sp. CRN 30]
MRHGNGRGPRRRKHRAPLTRVDRRALRPALDIPREGTAPGGASPRDLCDQDSRRGRHAGGARRPGGPPRRRVRPGSGGQAADAHAALEAAERGAPDVALLDIDLPGTDGLALARELPTRAPACRTLMLTAFDRPGYVGRALDAGASGYLLKSVSPPRLAAAVRTAHAGGRAMRCC